MKLLLSAVAYAAAVVGANYLTSSYGLVPAGFGLEVTAGTYAAGAALLARDFVQRYGGIRTALAAIAAGTAVSLVLADPRIALASAVAFLAAELVDLAVFTPLRRRGFVRAALASNLASAPVDTLAFLALAGFPITLEAVGGQLLAKLAWATVVPLALYLIGRRALLRHTLNPTGA